MKQYVFEACFQGGYVFEACFQGGYVNFITALNNLEKYESLTGGCWYVLSSTRKETSNI